MSRGPRYKNRYKLTGSDTPEDCRRRLGEMAVDAVRRERIRLCVKDIYKLASACETVEDTTRGSRGKYSVSMKIRHFHNELELHVHRHCMGALYRSAGIAGLAESKGIQSRFLRQEHTIPANVLAGMVFHGIKKNKTIGGPASLCRFLLTQSVVTAITRVEDWERLTIERSYGERRPHSKWKDTHPDFCRSDEPGRLNARPFLRYHGTGLAVTFWPTGEDITLETDTLAKHICRVEQLPLYDWRIYFEDLPMVA